MNNSELINRYVYAVTRQLPSAIRSDVDKELRELISDMLEERCGDMTPTETDVKVVLTELGTPSELALKYDPRGERSLIGPKYFRDYLKVLLIVVAAQAGALVLASIIAVLTGESTGPWYMIVFEWLNNIWNSSLSAFAFVTIIFAIIEYKGIDITQSDELSKLPAVPEKSERIPKVDCILGIVFNTFFLVIFSVAPQIISCAMFVSDSGKEMSVPFFNTEVLRSLWVFWGISFVVGIALECLRLVIGRYDIKNALITVVCNTVICIMSAFVLLRNDLVNAEGIRQAITALEAAPDEAQIASKLLCNVNIVIFAIMVFANVIDAVTAVVKGIKYSSKA